METAGYRDSSSSSLSDDESEVVNFYSSEDNNTSFDEDSQMGSSDESGQGTTAEQSMQSTVFNPPVNIIHKLFNRERFGNFSGSRRVLNYQERAFETVPERMQCCLKDILGFINSFNQVYMGLSACGQFFLSFKVDLMENPSYACYSFVNTFKYTLYFWIYKPGERLKLFAQRCMFDDHGVDNTKNVIIAQWSTCDSRVLVVHGAPQDECDDSYISYIRVPKLGCLECAKIRDNFGGGSSNATFCLKCNLTVHTKYSRMESDKKFDPYLNLLTPDRILLVSNGFMHLIKTEIESPPIVASNGTAVPMSLNMTQNPNLSSLCAVTSEALASHLLNEESGDDQAQNNNITNGSSKEKNETAKTLSDSIDLESFSTTSTESPQTDGYMRTYISTNETTPRSRKFYINSSPSSRNTITGEGINGNANGNASGNTSSVLETPASVFPICNRASRISLVRHRDPKTRIVTKTFRNGVLSVDMQGPSLPSTSTGVVSGEGNSSTNINDKSNAYEFSEENEKCEGISTLRKRRLAEKKYEFSEDNSENIVPFTKLRSTKTTSTTSTSTARFGTSPNRSNGSAWATATTPVHNYNFSPCPSPTYAPHTAYTSPTHSGSPMSSFQQGFRSPHSSGSPLTLNPIRSPSRNSNTQGTSVANVQRSPQTNGGSTSASTTPTQLSVATQQMLSYKPLGALSPIQVSMGRSRYDINCMSPNANLIEVNLQAGILPEKPMCVKQLKRRFIEEDDAATVITSEEDDCISPGYHTSLPLEVHGSGYSAMQMISKSSYARLRCPSVVVTQFSFDLEAFTYYVISTLCQKNDKTYEMLNDWASDIVTICPMTKTAVCLLVAMFSARDQIPNSAHCFRCVRKIACAFHYNQYECNILFAWNMEEDKWEVLDYGELREVDIDVGNPIKRGTTSLSLFKSLKKLVPEIRKKIGKNPNHVNDLRIHDCNLKKSKSSMLDIDHMAEFSLRRKIPSNFCLECYN